MNTLTRELTDLLWPKHDRNSCSDENLANADVHFGNGASRCRRCMALDNLGELTSGFQIDATICVESTAIARERALKKLTLEDKQALGLVSRLK